ncbi:MAG: hypothetical protein K9N05_05455 [Candidatus Marinimicrobia bacterium]|nr:hypothetical protein [Candidatus Neomarinimicrobiota bacterium]
MKKIQNIIYPYKKSELLIDYHLPDKPSDVTIILGHGKFNDMNIDLFIYLKDYFPKENVNIVRFNYPFTEHVTRVISRRKCKIAYQAVLDDVRSELPDTKFLFIGGKSLSAIIASQLENVEAAGYAFLTYPLHLPVIRIPFTRKSLFKLKKPMMFISGSEDKFADRGMLELLMGALNPYAHLMMIPNTGHSLELLHEEKRTQEELHKEIADILLWFMSDVIEKRMKN